MRHTTIKSILLITIILMDLLTGMEFDLFVPSLPELRGHFGLTPFWAEALLSVNFIGYCVSLFFVGELADRYGRKPIILLGLLIFVIGSVCCVWPLSWHFLLMGRFFQGIGVAAPAILSFLIIADEYPLKEQQFLMAMLNGALNTAAAIAPVVGSYITWYFHWQGNFTALLLLGLITLIMTIFFIPMYKLPEHKELNSVRSYLSLFQSKSLMLLIAAIVFMIVPYWIFVGISPLLYIEDLGVSLAHFGYYQGSFALVFALGSVIFGLIMHRYNQKKMLLLSSKIVILSFITVALATFFNVHNPLLITLAFMPFVISQIIPSTILYPLCLQVIPQAKGRVSALLQGGRLIFSAVSLQIIGHFYSGSFQNMGIILIIFIFLVIVTLFLVIHNEYKGKQIYE